MTAIEALLKAAKAVLASNNAALGLDLDMVALKITLHNWVALVQAVREVEDENRQGPEGPP